MSQLLLSVVTIDWSYVPIRVSTRLKGLPKADIETLIIRILLGLGLMNSLISNIKALETRNPPDSCPIDLPISNIRARKIRLLLEPRHDR